MRKKKKQGKKKFGMFFRRRFLLCLVICILIAVSFFKFFLHIDQWTPDAMNDYNFFVPAQYYFKEQNWKKYDEQGRIADALAVICGCRNFSTSDANENTALLYQPETGEILIESPFASACIWQNGESRQYTLRDRSILEHLDDTAGHFTDYYGEFIIYSVYVKDDQFIPGEVFVQKNKGVLPLPRFKKAGSPISGEWIDLSPDDKKGWTKICSSKSKETLTVYPDWDSGDYGLASTNRSAEEKSADGCQYLGSVRVYGSLNEPQADRFIELISTFLPREHHRIAVEENSRLQKLEGETVTDEMLYEGDAEDKAELLANVKKNFAEQRYALPEKIFNNYIDYWHRRIPEYPVNVSTEEIAFRGQTWQLVRFVYVEPAPILLQVALTYAPNLIGLVLLAVLAALLWSVIAYLLYSRKYDIEAYRRNLTGALAHDLKTPLAVIYGHAENIRAHTHPESADEYADCIMENVTHIDEMIAGVLDLAQLEGRAAPAMKEKLDLTELLHAAFLRNAALMEQRGLTLTESGQLTVKGNPDMMAQLCENLAANAVQHTAEGGAITVTAEKRSIRISNPYTGELDAKTLCEPFKRGDAARGSQSGSGLGLSIVQQIAALHKLRLRVTAKDGIFTVELKRRRFR